MTLLPAAGVFGYFDFISMKVLSFITLGVLAAILAFPIKSKQNHLTLALLLFLGFGLLASGLSEKLPDAFLGSPTRGMGWLTWLGASLWALAVSQNKVDWLKPIAIFGLSSAILALAFGPHPAFDYLYSSPFGNPNTLGKILAVTLFTSLSLSAKNKDPRWLIAALPQLLVLAQTGNRASWLALLAVGSITLFTQHKKALSIALLSVAALLPFAWPQLIESHSLVTRLELYQASLKAIAHNPFIGYGFEHNALLPYLPNFTLNPDRAHQLFLDAALSTGIYGALSLAFLSIGSLITLYKNKVPIAASALLILLLSTQVSFLSPSSLFLFMTLIGLALRSKSPLLSGRS